MPIAYSIVSCTEVHGTKTERWDVDRWSPSVQLRCLTVNKYALVADLLGNQRVWPHSGFSDLPRAKSATIVDEPGVFATDGQACVYEFSRVTVGYSSKVEVDLVSESLEPTAEFQVLDYTRFRWTSKDGDPILEGEAPGKITRSLALSRQLFKLTAIPNAVLDQIGNVNDAEYESTLLGLTFPIETLLFQPPSMTRTITTAGSKGWNLNMRFHYKPEGWNKFWRAAADPPEWEEMFDMDVVDAYKNYPLGDFSALLF
jgi:hypothetical protein